MTAVILTTSFENSLKYLFDLIDVSNFKHSEFLEFCDEIKVNNEFLLDYFVIDEITNFVQEKLIPDFKSTKIDLKYLKDKYENIIDSLKKSNTQIKFNDENIINFQSLIIIFELLEILPKNIRNKYLSKLSEIKGSKARFGGGSDLMFVREQILKIFFESSEIKEINSEDYCLVISEYVVLNAGFNYFEFYTDPKYDKLLQRFSKLEMEKISSSLSHFMCKNIKDFFSVKDLKRGIELIKKDPNYIAYNKFLLGMELDKPKHQYLVVSLIDSLYIRGVDDPVKEYETEFLELFELIRKNSNFAKDLTSLTNIMYLVILRLIFNKQFIRENLREKEEYRNALNAAFTEDSRSKDYFIDNPNSAIFLFFLQSLIREFGDLSTYQREMNIIYNLAALILDNDIQGTIAFFDNNKVKYFLELRDEIDDAAYKGNTEKMSDIFGRTYKGSLIMNQYMIGVNFINKFINSVTTEDKGVIDKLKEYYLESISKLNTNPHFIELLKIIINDSSFEFSSFMGGDGAQYEIRLKKTFLQFMLISILFEDFGYDYNAWKTWKDGTIVYPKFKMPLATSNKLSNY